jgi:HSP20 family protein
LVCKLKRGWNIMLKKQTAMTLIKFQKDSEGRTINSFPAFSTYFGDLFENVVTSDFKKWTNPSVNIVEKDQEFVLELAAPGLSKEDFMINIDDQTLKISAEKKQDQQEKNEKFTRREFSFSSFSRSFTLPETINIEMIKATYENGIMRINLPKMAQSKPKVKEVSIS